MDKALGFFFDQLKVMGLEEDTIIVFTSDNGPEDYQISNAGNAAMGSPGEKRGRKRSVYGGGVHVPCIVRWPGKVPAGRIDSETIWAGVDVLPTLLKLANISDSIKTSGEDVSPALLGNPFKRAKPLFWEWRFDVKRAPYTPPSLAVQDGEWRGYVNADGSRAELYNTAVDSQESKNLADENPERSAQLVAEMLNWKGRLSQ
jgi:N-acetylgalactosamine-6-sulfatase